jgi:putative phosphoesterase
VSSAPSGRSAVRVGVISDTHGLLRPEALEFLAGSDRIIHAGDVGGAPIVEALSRLAPLVGVRGNNDQGDWAEALPESAWLRIGPVAIHVTHVLAPRPALPPGADVAVAGHSHQPRVERRGAATLLNPGSAGPRRFKLPIALGELRIDGDHVVARVLTLDDGQWREAGRCEARVAGGAGSGGEA